MASFRGRVFATMLRMSESGKHSRAAKRRRGLAQWHRVVLAALVAGTVGGSAYAFFPGTAAAPVADRTPGRPRKPRPVPTPKPSAPASSPAATPSASPVDAAGIGFYDGKS